MELTSEFIGRKSFDGFDNYSEQPSNTCGQAVIASMMRFTGRIPPEMKELRNSKTELTRFAVQRFGPNWPLRNMMSNRKTITNALQELGIDFSEHIARPFANGDRQREKLVEAISERKHPVIVLLDVHTLGWGKRFNLHWAVVYAVSRDFVRISSWGKTYDVAWKDFMNAWKIWFLTYPYSYYMIEITTPQSEDIE